MATLPIISNQVQILRLVGGPIPSDKIINYIKRNNSCVGFQCTTQRIGLCVCMFTLPSDSNKEIV